MKKYSKKEYIFTCSAMVILGTGTNLLYGLILKMDSDRAIKPRRVVSNIAIPNMVFFTDIMCSSENVCTDNGLLDATVFWNLSKGRKVSWPTISVADATVIHAHYTGYVPPGYFVGQPYIISLSIIGPEVRR
jgi:hypothetical protein